MSYDMNTSGDLGVLYVWYAVMLYVSGAVETDALDARCACIMQCKGM